MFKNRFDALLLILLAAAVLQSRAGAESPSPLKPFDIKPTVTRESGDLGGKFFGKAIDGDKVRRYYIAAEPQLWDFAPIGQDPICAKVFPPSLLLNRTAWKMRYVQYADPAFTARVLPSARLGIMGPVIRGVGGETIAVTLYNRCWRPVSMHPHGVLYDKDSEGSYYRPNPGLGSAVAPGAKFTYVWKFDESATPGADEPSSKAWLYHSHVAGDEEVNLGLFGCIVVTDPARARADGTPKDVDREMAAAFTIFDESNDTAGGESEEEDERPDPAASTATTVQPVQKNWAEEQRLIELSQRHTINGLTYGNLTGLEMNEGERVRWYLFGLGSETDLHTAHWHGLRVTEGGRRRTDAIELLPGSMKVVDMTADNPGDWLFHCHVSEHMQRGMFTKVVVHKAGADEASRAPEDAFFGMPQSLSTLRLEGAELTLDPANPGQSEIFVTGRVTVPDPLPVARCPMGVKLGDKTVVLNSDRSGICSAQNTTLLVKNITSYGVVKGGEMHFELSLRGAEWVDELRKLEALKGEQLGKDVVVKVTLQMGQAVHESTCALKMAQ